MSRLASQVVILILQARQAKNIRNRYYGSENEKNIPENIHRIRT